MSKGGIWLAPLAPKCALYRYFFILAQLQSKLLLSNRMSWNGIGGAASWAGNASPFQKLTVGNIPTTIPTYNDISNGTIGLPTLTIAPRGNTVDIPLEYWSFYEASNHIWIRDTTGGNIGDIENIGGDLYWNSNLIGLASNIPDIGDWAFYPALDNIDMDGKSILNCCNLFVSTVFASTISTVGLRARDISVSTLRGVNAQLSTAQISTVFTNYISAATVQAADVSSIRSRSQNTAASSLSLYSPSGTGNLTSVLGSILLWNGEAVATSSNDAILANWSKYPILTGCNVAASGNNLTTIGNGNGAVKLDGGSISMESDRTITLSNDRGVSLLGPAEISLYTTNGTFGKISLVADSGTPVDPLTDAGGLVDIKANSALSGTTPLALSRINQEAATLTLNAGAVGALAYVPGSVNILSGLGTGVQILTGTGVINIASGQALTLAAAQAVAINGGAGGVRMTNTSGSKLQSDWLLPYQSNYTFISSFTNEYGYSKQLEASTLTVYEELDVLKKAYITNATINRIFGPGPDLPITNTGGIELQVAPGNRIACYEVDLSFNAVNAARFQAGAMFASSLNTLGNIGSCNFVVGAGGSFGTLQASNISTTTWTGVDGGYISSMANQDWLILNSLSTQNVYAQVALETDGALIAPTVNTNTISTATVNAGTVNTNTVSTATVQAGSVSTNTISTGAVLVSTINGFPYPAPIYAAFSSSNSQTVTAANTPTALTYTNTEVSVGGITVAGSQITVPATGNYSILTSIQFDKTGGGTDTVNFWFRINGVDVPRSATRVAVAGTNGETVGTVEIIAPMTSGQYVEVFIASADPTMQAESFPAQVAPYPAPAIPSVITTVKRLLT